MNRLHDLNNYVIQVDEIPSNDQKKRGDGVEGAERGSIEELYKIIEIVKHNINSIINITQQIVRINQNLQLATTDDQENEIKNELHTIIQNGNKNAKLAQMLLKDLNKEMKNSVTKLNSSDSRIRKNLIQTSTKKYLDVLREYQNTQNKSKEINHLNAVNRIKQVKPDVTTDEIDAVIRSGNAANFIKLTILTGDASGIINRAVENAQRKYQEVLRLEQSVAELAQIFQDFALIIDTQGEFLNQIENHVISASEYVDQGNNDTEVAVVYIRDVRKKQVCICVCVFFLVIIIISAIAGSLTK